MKNLSAIVFILIANCSIYKAHLVQGETVRPKIFENELNQTLEDVKQTLKDGDWANGIPSFDPFYLRHINVPLNIDEIIDANLSFSNLRVYGIPYYTATELDVSLLPTKLAFTFVVPRIEATATYVGEGKLFQFVPLVGDGKIGVTIYQLKLKGEAKLNLLGGIKVQDVELVTSLDDAKFELTGFMGEEHFSELIAEALDEYVASLLNQYQQEISEIISPMLKEVINMVLAGLQRT